MDCTICEIIFLEKVCDSVDALRVVARWNDATRKTSWTFTIGRLFDVI